MADANKVDIFVDALHEEGYRAKPYERDGTFHVESATSGYTILFSFASEGTIQMFCGIKRAEDSEISFESINDFNRKYRFAKMYLDDDRDLNSQADFFFDPSASTVKDNIRQILSLMDVTVSEMKVILANSSVNQA
ncbi:MAG: YbjN domain-containing protein [Devosia sp.]